MSCSDRGAKTSLGTPLEMFDGVIKTWVLDFPLLKELYVWKHSLAVRRDGNSPLLFGNENFSSLWSSELVFCSRDSLLF